MKIASLISLGIAALAIGTPAMAQTQSKYYARTTIAPKSTTPASTTPPRTIKCSSPQTNQAAGDNSRKYLGNVATLALALEACETRGASNGIACSAAQLATTTSDGVAGSYNTFVQTVPTITAGGSAWTSWTCVPA